MKGLISIIEVGIAAVILLVSFVHFFPQYSIRSNWDEVMLETRTEDILNVIDNMNETYNFATDTNDFHNFMDSITYDETGVFIYWKTIEGLDDGESEEVTYFSKAQQATIFDVRYTDSDGFEVYSFTLGMGYPY